jgi:hypothetical protein
MSTRGKSMKDMGLANPRESNGTGAIVSILYNTMILVYLIKLEDKMCNCIRDWRHDFMKYFSLALIVLTVIFAMLGNGVNKEIVQAIKAILMAGSLINFYALYTYVGDLDRTNCQCAVSKQQNIHYFLYIWRYVMLIGLILGIVGIVIMSAGLYKKM